MEPDFGLPFDVAPLQRAKGTARLLTEGPNKGKLEVTFAGAKQLLDAEGFVKGWRPVDVRGKTVCELLGIELPKRGKGKGEAND